MDYTKRDVSETTVRTQHGTFRCLAFEDEHGVEHLAAVKGDVSQAGAVLVRIHSECLTGDVFGSRRCDCGEQLQQALAQIGSAAIGVVVYLRGHEGRGIGLVNKLRAYRLQDAGLDTVDANLALGLPVDAREYEAAGAILRYLGVGAVHLLTNNPAKAAALATAGVQVVSTDRVEATPNPDNVAYLQTKRVRMGHRLECVPEATAGPEAAIVGLGGGIGASRLWTRLAAACAPENLTVVVNVADDVWMHGLRVCPDIDTVLYALSGRQDAVQGWGVRGDTFRCMDALRDLGEDVWFNVGDVDLATHLLRSRLLAQGLGLGQVTARLSEGMGVRSSVLPASDDEIRTMIRTGSGQELQYQEFLVQRQAGDEVLDVRWEGLAAARAGRSVLESIENADLIVLGPSNPVASVLPILGIPGIREAIRASAAPVVAVTPVVASVGITDDGETRRARSRARLLTALGLEHRASSVARLYADLIDSFIVDEADASHEMEAIEDLGVTATSHNTLLHTARPGSRLVPALVEMARSQARDCIIPGDRTFFRVH